MSITCGYDAEAQDAVERGAERFPMFCALCDQHIPFHSPTKQTRIRPDIAQLAHQIDMRDFSMMCSQESHGNSPTFASRASEIRDEANKITKGVAHFKRRAK